MRGVVAKSNFVHQVRYNGTERMVVRGTSKEKAANMEARSDS